MNTVGNLPTSKVAALLEALQDAILNRPYNTHLYSQWLKYLLRTHITTLINKNNLGLVNNLKTILESRTKSLHQLCKLKGKLSVLVGEETKARMQRKEPKRVVREADEEEKKEQSMEGEDMDMDMDIEMEMGRKICDMYGLPLKQPNLNQSKSNPSYLDQSPSIPISR